VAFSFYGNLLLPYCFHLYSCIDFWHYCTGNAFESNLPALFDKKSPLMTGVDLVDCWQCLPEATTSTDPTFLLLCCSDIYIDDEDKVLKVIKTLVASIEKFNAIEVRPCG
jgi:hypothetical protein